MDFEDRRIRNQHGPTICRLALGSGSLSDFAFLFQVDVPTLCVTLCVLESKGEDGIALLDGVFPLALALLERFRDQIEGYR